MSQNKFAKAMKKPNTLSSISTDVRHLDRGSKHIGGYFQQDVSRKLKQIALDENTTIQALLGEAIVMLLESRNETVNKNL